MSRKEPNEDAGDLKTLRDFLRYATSRFTAAKLSYGHGTTNAFDEAAFMVLEGLHLPIDQLEPFLEARLTKPERARLAELIEARITTRKPASYLLQRAYIGGIGFHVDERVIVPRSFIGELLLSGAVAGSAESLIADPGTVGRALDLCTGSGCLAILAAMTFPAAKLDAVDLSQDALEVARINVAEHDMKDRIELLHGDLFAPLAERRYDLIISNPPYVDAKAMAKLPPEFKHEPAMALGSGKDGLDIVRKILGDASQYLNTGGGLLCEIGRGRELLIEQLPDLDFHWLDTEHSQGEVFWLSAAALKHKNA
ncbi:MAG: 50S ribosomal protein L3 N(5)-glutamine methyltransferase [Rhodospirillales bacterium]